MKNCWEHKKCGREPGGREAESHGVCPAAVEKRLDGVHGGKNAGRSCWIIAGTLCGGEVQGTFARKYASCEKCDFYRSVMEESMSSFTFSSVLLARLNKKTP